MTSAGDVGGTIDFLSWEGYDIPDAMAPWKETVGVRLNPTYIGNHDDIQAKIKAGGGSFDLITHYQGYKPLFYDALEIIGQTKGIASSYGDMTTLIVSGEATVAPLAGRL